MQLNPVRIFNPIKMFNNIDLSGVEKGAMISQKDFIQQLTHST